MKIGEWEGIGRSRALVAYQLGELHADEYAAHVTMFENGRQRILVAADVGLFEFNWGRTPANRTPSGTCAAA